MSGCLLLESSSWQAFVVKQDEMNRSSVRLCGVENGRQFCVNDLLVQQEYAAVVGDRQLGRCCQQVNSALHPSVVPASAGVRAGMSPLPGGR